MSLPIASHCNSAPGFVEGRWYGVWVLGGAHCRFWVSRKLKRNELRLVALEYLDGEYENCDIDKVRLIDPAKFDLL